jgi:hypothetical protein
MSQTATAAYYYSVSSVANDTVTIQALEATNVTYTYYGSVLEGGGVDPIGGGDFGPTTYGPYVVGPLANGQGFVTVEFTNGADTPDHVLSNTPLTPGQSYTFDPTGDFAPCYRRGTLIRTVAGDLPVESLREGELVTLANGSTAAVIWLGHRKLNCARHPNPKAIWPILVRAGAFGENLPSRDLYLSPGHSIFVGGVLMQAEKLVNGATISQVETDEVEYWHVALANHAIILAENLPAESYLDQGNRTAFANGGAFVEAHPDFRPKHWAETCVPLVFEGPEMQDAKAALLARAAELGHYITHEDGLHIIADGERFDPVRLGQRRAAFRLPAGCASITLVSRTFIPAQINPKSGDGRILGVFVQRLQLDGSDIMLNDNATFGPGWNHHEPENNSPGARWTTGVTPIAPSTKLVMIDFAGQGHYWSQRETAKIGQPKQMRTAAE